MFATIKSLIPEPRQANQPRHYVGRHRQPEQTPNQSASVVSTPVPVPVTPASESQDKAAA